MALSQVEDQAFITLATNDNYGLGALTLGHSLKKVGTTRSLVCMVTSDVSPSIREELAHLYVIEEVNILDSHDSVNLALLTRPDLGVTFTKLHCWRLTQYSKCVFMDADTLVLQNIDDLFEREELSAASDIGWPDCFNSGVFVFKPSEETYHRLLQFVLSRGSFDGGDQGLLNSFFSDWSTSNIKFHLPFLYNVVAQAFYTYKPAFKRFGKEAKVIHFIGPYKPWHGTYHPETGSVDCPGDLGLNCQEFVKLWWEIFVQNVKLSKEYVKDEEIAPSPKEDSPPKVVEHHQLRWEKGDADYLGVDRYENIQKQLEMKSGIVHVAELVPVATEAPTHKEHAVKSIIKQMPTPEFSPSVVGPEIELTRMKVEVCENIQKQCENSKPRHEVLVQRQAIVQHVVDRPVIHHVVDEPPSYDDDVDRRYKWEIGQVDYLGKDSFENIMKRLDEKTRKFENPISTTLPMPSPTYKSEVKQIATLSDKTVPLHVKEDIKLKSTTLQHSAEDVVSGTFKMQSSSPLTKAEDLPRRTETSDKVVSYKEMKSGSFVLQASNEKIIPVPETEIKQEQVIKAQKTQEQHSPPESAKGSQLKVVSDRVLHGHPLEIKMPGKYVFQSAGEQEIREKVLGRYTFQLAGEQMNFKSVEKVVAKESSKVLEYFDPNKHKVEPERQELWKIHEQRSAPDVHSQAESDIAESWFEESFRPVRSIENFSAVISVKRRSLKVDVFEANQVKESYMLRSGHPQVFTQTINASSSSPSSSRLVSGAKYITVVTKARSDKK